MSREVSLDGPQSSGEAPAGATDTKAPPSVPGIKKQGGQEEEESASNVLRRLSSPIFGAAGFASDSDDDNGNGKYDSDRSQDGDEDEEEEEAKEVATELIQRWWRECRRASKRVRVVVAAKPAFVRVQQLFDKLDAGQMSFERTGLALQNPDIQRAVTKALSVVPRDEGLIAMPRASRSTRAVLSSLMIVYHPSEVLVTEDGDGGAEAAAEAAAAAATSTTPPSPTRVGAASTAAAEGVAAAATHDSGGGNKKMDHVAAALRNASALLLASIKAVTASLGPVVAGEVGARKTLAVRLNVLRLCRRYFAVSLVSWKDKDAQRVAAQVVQPYARAYAMRLTAVAQGDERMAEMVQGQLNQYRRALEHLIGQERASNSLQEVELAVKADVSLSLDRTTAAAATPQTSSSPSSSSPPRSATSTATGATVSAAADIDGPLPKNSSTSNPSSSTSRTATATSGGSGSAPNTGTAASEAATAAATTGAGRGGGSGGAATGGGGCSLPDGRLGRLLGNERLAHEILVNPDFQIPANEEDDGASPASSPEEELARRFKDVMRRIFWDRFTQSLLPPPDTDTSPATVNAGSSSAVVAEGSGVEEKADAVPEVGVEVPGLPPLRAGCKVHARYGSERGSYYVATVLAVVVNNNKSEGASSSHSQGVGAGFGASEGVVGGGTVAAAATNERAGAGAGAGDGGHGNTVFVDVRYDEDGTVEKAVPVSRLKKRDEPPDFGPLLALLGEVREELVSLTPNNTTLVGEVRAVLSKEKLAELLQHKKKLDARQVQGLVAFIASRIHSLQAPVREAGARNWLKGFDANMEAAAASGDASAVIHLLPRVFEFVFAQMEEIKRDSANAHIRLIAPYLARHGAAYERAKFEARLSAGSVSLDLTRAWLSSAVKGFLSADTGEGEGGAVDDGERARRAKGLRDGREELHKSVLQQAFVGLLRSPIRLDRPEAAATILPETLGGDGGRLAAARDDVDRVALVATLCVLVRQVLARLRIGCPAPAMAALQARTCSLLKQEGVNLPQIVEECVATAGRLAVASSSASSKEETAAEGLPAADKESLRSLLMSSADPNNEVFRVFFKRVILALKGMVAGGDATEVCQRNGLNSFVEELKPAGARLQRLFSHNVKVYAGHYGPIVTEAALSLNVSIS